MATLKTCGCSHVFCPNPMGDPKDGSSVKSGAFGGSFWCNIGSHSINNNIKVRERKIIASAAITETTKC